MSKILMFDVEADGLYGKGFAVGAIVVETDGINTSIIDKFELMSNETITNQWVIETVLPYLGDMPKCETNKDLRDKFYNFLRKHKDAKVYSDCNYPVETNFLADIVKDNEFEREFNMPYPLMDIATIENIDISREAFYFEKTFTYLKAHNPLNDSIESLYFFLNHKLGGFK